MKQPQNLITLLGPTAVGKTVLAARFAHAIGGEIISADSRQVFRRMDIGTGKDLSDYLVNGELVPSHLIDIAEPGTEYSLFTFLGDFTHACQTIRNNGKVPILCGGTGLYIEAVLKGYDMAEVPINDEFRASIDGVDNAGLYAMLLQNKTVHNSTDSIHRDRIIRALEIELFKKQNPGNKKEDFSNTLVFGLRFDRQAIRKRITLRLNTRLNNGLIEEVESLIRSGVSVNMLKQYGLEYKYVAMYLMKELAYEEMSALLNTAIHQFAKRQTTWFRRMERNGIFIHWLEGEEGPEHNLVTMLAILSKR